MEQRDNLRRQRRRNPRNGLRIVKVRVHRETLRKIRTLERQEPRQSLQTSTRHDQRSQSQCLLHHNSQRISKSLQSTIRGLGESSSKRSQSKGCRTSKPNQRKCRKRTGRGNRSPKRHSSNHALRQRRLGRNNLPGRHPGRYKRKRRPRCGNMDQRSPTGKVARKNIRDNLVNATTEGSNQGQSPLKPIIR